VKGQADLISAVILVSVVLVMSISFLGYASSLLSQKTAESDLNNFFQKEIANTVIYKEYIRGETIYLGVVRVDGTETTYYYLAINNTYCSANGVISGGDFPQIPGLVVPSSRVYIMTNDNQYVQLSAFTPYMNSITTVNLGFFHHRGGNELLIIDFTNAIPNSPPASPNCLVIILFIQVNGNYYEVGRYYETT
jgi:hypothetical protein